MELLIQLFNALRAQDFKILTDPSMLNILYSVLFIILFFESGLIPAAFLPGDSLLILVGILCAKGVMAFSKIVIFLTIAASLGFWIGYIQGKWLSNKRIIQNWLTYLPTRYHHLINHLFHKHGLLALLIGRFIAFVRTILPIIAGLSGFNNIYFHFFNWMSSFLWVLILTTCGFLLGKISIFIEHEDKLIFYLALLPIGFLTFGLIRFLSVFWKRKHSA